MGKNNKRKNNKEPVPTSDGLVSNIESNTREVTAALDNLTLNQSCNAENELGRLNDDPTASNVQEAKTGGETAHTDSTNDAGSLGASTSEHQLEPVVVPTTSAPRDQPNPQHLTRDSPLPLDDIVEADTMEMIGEGVFGEVYKAIHRRTKRQVAIKKIKGDIEYDHQGGVPSQILREVSILRDLVHPNVVEFLDVKIYGMNEYILLFEYVQGGDLHKMLKSLRNERRRMGVNLIRKYALDLLSGIHACHTRLVIHRDLKPQNILIGLDGLKIADFGLSRIFSLPVRNYSLEVITLWYRAPEILLGCQRYGPEVDMWSAGCILGEMAKGSALFNGDSEIDTVFKIFQHCGTPNEVSWPELANLEHWKPRFPKWPPTNLEAVSDMCPELREDSMELIRGLLVLVPQTRFSARNAKNRASQCIQNANNAASI